MTIGIDIGSTNIKIYDGANLEKYPTYELKEILGRYDINTTYATGYFRKKFKNNITEITTAIYGIDKDIDLIIDIGGQDTKIINTRTLEFTMNDKCGAGTGLFLQTVASYLNFPIEQLGSCYIDEPLQLNNTCAVFSISEVINNLVNGHNLDEIMASINYAVAKKINNINNYDYETVALIGGVANNKSFVKYFEEISEKKVYVPKYPQFINAIGARRYGIEAERRIIN